MDDFRPETYGERVADVYDQWYKPVETDAEVALLAELAVGGRALELGVGTGRVAIPLAQHGVEVVGLDASPAMIAAMRKKPGGDLVGVEMGDMETVDVAGEFSLVFVVFNTFFQLYSQESQLNCFKNVARRLQPGGRFLIHGFVPDLSVAEAGQHIGVREAGLDLVRLEATTYDRLEQRIDTTQIRITEQGIRLVHAKLRYALPSELDLMAQVAGLHLEARYGAFDKSEFNDASAWAVSIYRA